MEDKVYGWGNSSYLTIKAIFRRVGITDNDYKASSQLQKPFIMGLRSSILDYGEVLFYDHNKEKEAVELLKSNGYSVEDKGNHVYQIRHH